MSPLYAKLPPDLQESVKAARSRGDDPDPEQWSPDRLLEVVCGQRNIPYFCLRPEMVDRRSFYTHRKACSRLRFLPLYENDIVVVVACCEPWNEGYLREVRKALHMEVHLLGVDEQDWDRAMSMVDDPISIATWEESEKPADGAPHPERVHILTTWDMHGGDYLAAVRDIVRRAHTLGASDIILDPMENRINARFRIMGNIEIMPPIGLDHRNGLLNAAKIFAGVAVEEARGFRSGRAQLQLGPKYSLGLRVETQPTEYGDAIVMRLLDPMSIRRHSGTLPFRDAALEMVQGCLNKASGIILVTGPTGSGKTTTLYRCLTSLDLSELNVRTIEDPIEYLVDKIVQTQVTATAGFAEALRSMLRADPDVLLVGEIRDTETAATAVQASLTGHLILSTLHTNDSIGSIPRLQDLKVSPFLIGQTLSLVIAQRLVGALCPYCRVPMTPDARVRRHFLHYGLEVPEPLYARGGCRRCGGTGLVGRLPIFEFFYISSAIRDLLQKEADASALRSAWMEAGGEPIAKSGLRLVASGKTSYEDVACYETHLF